MNNPFEYIQSMMNNDGFTKTMNGAISNMDLSSLSEAMRNTAEMFSNSNQITTENMQMILKKSSDNLQKNTSEMYNSMKDAISSGDTGQIIACQQKFIQSTLENNFNNTKEVLELASKTAIDMLTMMQTNLVDNTDKIFTKVKKAN